MRTLGAILITTMVLAFVVGVASPALAGTITETQSFVNSSGNTVTVESTYVDGVLVSRTSTETRTDGTVVLSKSWDFYSSGAVQTYEEFRYFSTASTHIIRQFSESGVLLFQRSELSMNGELSVVSLTTYNSSGDLLTQETRRLIPLADGTQVWEVTVSTYQDGVLVSTTVTQYPYGYNFDAPTEEALPQRPGYGHGDKNHKHTGAPGLANGNPGQENAARGREMGNRNRSGNGAAIAGSNAERPGHGYGDENHERTGDE